jgi:uncharacterized protein (DUF4213/DUF364 family)
MIIEQTLQLLKENYSDLINDLRIEDVRIGSYLTAIKLSDGSCGISSNIEDSEIHCDRLKRDYGDFTPMHILGQSVLSLFETTKQSAVIEMLRIASLNAISSSILSSGAYTIKRATDPFDVLAIEPESTVTIVGAFHSYIQKCVKIACKLHVLEMNLEALDQPHKEYFVPVADFCKVIPYSDFVIITGLALVNNTLDQLLDCVNPQSVVVVTGPSSSIIPDMLFAKKVKLIGGTLISKPEVLFPLVSQGAAGYHLFEYCAEKICIVNDK